MGSESADHDWPQLERQKSSSAPTTPTFNGGNDRTSYGDDDMGPSVSMAVQADDDESFKRNTFNLKRTRSMGYFDDYIDPTKKLLGKSTSKEGGVSEERGDFEASEGSEDYDDDYNTDSDSGSGSYSDNDDNDNFANEEEEVEPRPRGLSPSVSPPPADTETLLLPQDDNDVMREPERHVDYLSHNWNEWDISKSWKYIILKKKKRAEDLVNAARLENASWRTWAKARNNLKTVLPEIVNWSKDSDVTWLYGPIVRDRDEDDASDVERGYGSDDENSKRIAAPTKIVMKKTPNSPTPKPILKKRTVSEILAENSQWKLNEVKKLINEMKHASVVMDPYGGVKASKDEYDDYDALAAKVNVQYYRSDQAHGLQPKDANPSKKVSDLISRKFGSSNRYSQRAQSRHTGHEESKSDEDGQPSSEHIESSYTFLKSNFKTEKSTKTKHIHFNDRVEQCMALATPASDSEYTDDENGTYFSRSIRKEASSKNEDALQSAASSGSSSSGDESDEDEDNAGLFINPTISRRTESNSHYTDSSSQNSSVQRLPLNPIIKLLPATTLNYGSDEEDRDNEEYNGYGNAVSHNVNTYRGYDYMYDYNSVYTGDTSSFLPVEGCDVVDVPDGIDLHAAMAADSASKYEMGQAVSSSNQEPSRHSKQLGTHSLFYDSSQSSDSDSEEQFIEDSQCQSSDEDEDGLSLKRTVSFGKNGKTNSLRDLTNPTCSAPFQPVKTRSFITGKAMNAIDKNQERSTAQEHTANGKKGIRPRYLKRNSSSSSFIFNSDSDEDSEDDEGGSDLAIRVEERAPIKPSKPDETDENAVDCQKSFFSNSRQAKPVPPQSTVVSSDPRAFTSPVPSQVSDMSKSLRLKNSSSLAEVGASDVAISGSFSPRSDSVKSVVSNQGIVNKTSPNELREMNEHLKAYHLDDQNETSDDDANESIQKMMLNARELAQKYLHSWKKPDAKQDDSKAGSIGT